MTSETTVIHEVPELQPVAAHQVAQRLYPAYDVRGGGTVQLAGCRLDDRLFLRCVCSLANKDETEARELFLSTDGEILSKTTVENLRLTIRNPLEGKPTFDYTSTLASMRQAAQEKMSQFWDVAPEEVVLSEVSLIWSKWASGKLRFTIGQSQEEMPFSGWTVSLAAPAFVCPHSGKTTFRIDATDDGKIAAAGAIAPCAISKKRVLESELFTSVLSGQRATEEFVTACPVTDETLLQRELVACKDCHRRVSPAAMEKRRCLDCRSFAKISAKNEVFLSLCKKYPALSNFKSLALRISLRDILLKTGLFKKMLFVFQKTTLELRFAGTKGFLGNGFTPVEVDAILGSEEQKPEPEQE